MTKSLDHEIYVTVPYIHIEVNYWVIPFHNLAILYLYVKWAFRYMTKSLDHEIYVTVPYIHIELNYWVILFHNLAI